MAYGQTGAGKTYTLSSRDPNAIGMMPRAAAAIFSAIEHDQSHSYTVMMSYIQLYMELLQVRPGACQHMPPSQGLLITPPPTASCMQRPGTDQPP